MSAHRARRTVVVAAIAIGTLAVSGPPTPDHPSGLSALAGAVVRTLQAFYGTDEATFGTTNTPEKPVTRTYTRFSQALEEIIDARVWSGIHFRHADEDGSAIGEAVARWRADHAFRPVHRHGHGGRRGDD